MFLLAVAVALLSLLAGCFRGNAPERNIEGRLEQLFPGQFQVLISNLNLVDLKALYRGDKKAIIAGKNDADVQFELNWQKGSDTLGVDPETVRAAYDHAKADAAQAKKLISLLHDHRLDKFSVSVIKQGAIIQVFAEPVPDVREQSLRIIKSTLDATPENAQTSIFVELMEPAAFHTRYQDFIPRGHWLTGEGWQKEQKIMSIDFEWTPALKLEKLLRGWKVNPDSKRSSQYEARAFEQSTAWASRNLRQPYHLTENPHGVEVPDGHGLTIRFGFPYFAETPTNEIQEPVGYVCGVFDTEKGTFTQLRKQTEF